MAESPLRLDGHVFKVGRDNAKLGDDERDFSVWISDDDGRVPLKTVAKTDYGDIEIRGVGTGFEPLRMIDHPLELRNHITAV